jgi:hypothetical protein
MENAINPTDDRLSDEELSLVHGGSIGSFISKLGQDIMDMLSTGAGKGGGSGVSSGTVWFPVHSGEAATVL